MHLYGSLNNYIQVNRKRTGLSQTELAALLAVEHHAVVSRYEQGAQLPDLEAVLALEIIFEEPAATLFAGVAERVSDRVATRAQALLEAMSDNPTAENLRKLELFAALARPDDSLVIPTWRDDA